MGLIKETNAQYYSGQHIVAVSTGSPGQNDFVFNDFNTKLQSRLAPNGTIGNSTSNFELYYISSFGTPPVLVDDGTLKIIDADGTRVLTLGYYSGGFMMCQLKDFAVQSNYGSYEYVPLSDIINNFLAAYVGPDNVLTRVRRSDVLFHAKRGLQEFSYDTLRSVKSQELTIPPSLSVPIPQDYVNYVRLSWIDQGGVRRIIYPTTLTTNPTELPIQDTSGIPIQDNSEDNLEANSSITEERWKTQQWNFEQNWQQYPWGDDWGYYPTLDSYGRLYGQQQQYAQANGWYTINERTGMFSFSSDLAQKIIVLEYISDGLGYDEDTKVPKMAEEAMYKHILYSLTSVRRNVPEYIVQRYKKDRYAALRNAKIRLSNIKLDEFIQVMRGKSKWLKH